MAIADLLDLHAIQAERCKRSLKAFAKAVWPIVEPSTPFIDGWVIDCLCDHLTALTRGDIHKLLINIPPRHSKSTICLIWRAWCWTHTPQDRFLCASYSLSLSIRDNRRTRMLIESDWYQQRYGNVFQLSGDMNLKGRFENDARGYNLAVSVGSATTGEGGSKLIIDDMHSAMEAYSDADRETALEWFRTVWSSRLNNQSQDKMLVIGQRIHDSDVSGYILSERPDWVHLNLPAYYEPSRHCHTSIGWEDPRIQEGELLWPERFSSEVLQGLQRDLGSSGFAAQYQQTPVPSGGGQFKEAWMRFADIDGRYYALETPEGLRHILIADCWNLMTVDLAISSKQDADYTVIQTWAVTPSKDGILIDEVHEHLDNPEQQKRIHSKYLFYLPRFVKIETTAYQLALAQQLLRQGVPCKEFKPVRDKVARASTASILMEAGKLYFLKTLPGLRDLIDELLHFPYGAHDDRVDSASMAAEELGMPLPTGGALVGLLPLGEDDLTPETIDGVPMTPAELAYKAFF